MLSFLEISHVTVLTKPPHFRLSEAFRWCRRFAPAGEGHLASDPLNEIFLLVLCAVISGSGGWTSIALHGEKKLEFLRRRRFLPFRDRTPCHDQLGHDQLGNDQLGHDQLGHDQLGHDQLGMLFSRLDMEGFQRRFIAWLSSLHETLEGIVAIDGKTLRRSFDTNSFKAPSI